MTNSEIVALVLEAIRRDRANVYKNPADCSFTLRVRTPAYDGEFWRFEPLPEALDGSPCTRATLKAYGERASDGKTVVCDGATLAPDTPKGVMAGAAMHDPGYLELDAIAQAWRAELFDPGPHLKRDRIARRAARGSAFWTHADVRLLFDAIFGDAMRKSGAAGFIQRLYYSAVRLFGGIFTGWFGAGASKALLAAALIGVGAGGGCAEPPDIIDWNTFTPPQPVLVRAEPDQLAGDNQLWTAS